MGNIGKVLILGLLFINPLLAQNLIVNDFGGKGRSFFVESRFVDGLHTICPMKLNAGIDVADLDNALEQNTVILENEKGDISFALGLFKPSHSNSILIIKAKNNVNLSVSSESVSLINFEIWAGGDVRITGPGLKTNGGFFKSTGQKITISNSGIKTGGGEIIMCYTDSISINGEGINTSGGNMTVDGGNIKISNDGVNLDNGSCVFTCTDDINITGNGITAENISSSGENISVESQGIRVENDVIFHHVGDVEISGEGIKSNGGRIYSYGAKDMRVFNMGLRTEGGEVFLDHFGDYIISGEGIETSGGNFILKGNGAFVGVFNNQGGSGIQTKNGSIEMVLIDKLLVSGNGIFSGEGDISIICKGIIDVDQGGISSHNGDIYVESSSIITLDGFNLNSNNGVKIGQGKLDTSQLISDSIVFLTEPVVGGGNVTIKTTE